MRMIAIFLIVLCLPTLAAAANEIRVGVRAYPSGTTGVSIPISVTSEVGELGGVSFALQYDPAAITLTSLSYVGPVSVGDFVYVELTPGGATFGVVFFDDSEILFLADGNHAVARARFDVDPGAPSGSSVISIVDQPPVSVEFATSAGAVVPNVLPGAIVVMNAVGTPEDGRMLAVGDTGEVHQLDTETGSLQSAVAPATTALGAVAIGLDGFGWVSAPGAGEVYRYDLSTTTPSVALTVPVGGEPRGLAVSPDGSIWVSDFSGDRLIQLTPEGAVLRGDGGLISGPVAVDPGPEGLAVDALGNVWVACRTAGSVSKLDGDGKLALAVTGLTQPTQVVIDRRGFVWVAHQDAGGGLQRRAPDGSLVEVVAMPGSSPRALAVRGVEEIWVAGATGVYRVRPQGDPAPFTPFVIGSAPSGVAIDARGFVWITDDSGEARRIDPVTGAELLLVNFAGPVRTIGDGSGYDLANRTQREVDFDGDGYASIDEVDSAVSPFDIVEVPIGFVAPVDQPSFVASPLDIALTWTLPPTEAGGYDTLTVQRTDPDGVVQLFSKPGDSISHLDTDTSAIGLGIYHYEVVGTSGGIDSSAVTIEVPVGVGMPLGVGSVSFDGVATTLFDVAVNRNADPAANEPAIYVTGSAEGKIYGFDRNFELLVILESPFPGQPILGIAFNPADALDPQATLFVALADPSSTVQIREISLSGAPLGPAFEWLLGGNPIFDSLGGLSYTEESGVPYLAGCGTNTCDCWTYNMLTGSVDPELSFAHPVGGFGLSGVAFPPGAEFDESGGLILLMAPVGEEFAIVEYDVEAGTPSATLTPTGLIIPLTGLVQEAYGGFDLFEETAIVSGISTSQVFEVSVDHGFVRGDSNIDGDIDVSDAIFTLGYLFTPGSATPDCEASADANDDGALDIADAVHLLGYLFIPGSPPPPAPFGGAPFLDLTEDSLACRYYPGQG